MPDIYLTEWMDRGILNLMTFSWLVSWFEISHLHTLRYILEIIKLPSKLSSWHLPFYHFPLNTHMQVRMVKILGDGDDSSERGHGVLKISHTSI